MASSLADVQKQCQGYRGKGGREKKVGELEASIEELKRKQTSLREQHALFTRTLKWELDLFHRTKNVDLHRAFAAFGAAHATYSAEITDGWEALSPRERRTSYSCFSHMPNRFLRATPAVSGMPRHRAAIAPTRRSTRRKT